MKRLILNRREIFAITSPIYQPPDCSNSMRKVGNRQMGCNNALCSDGCVYSICPSGATRTCGAQDQ